MKNTGLITLICILALALPAYGANVTIGNYSVAPNGSVVAQLTANGVSSLFTVTVNLTYNPAVVNVTSVNNGTGNNLTVGSSNIVNSSGFTVVTSGADITGNGLNGTVIIANITLTAVGLNGTSSPLNITIVPADITDINGNLISVSPENGTFNITGATLSISANLTTVTVGTASSVAFNVTNNGAPVNGASVNLSGAGISLGGTTNATGIAVISVNATAPGTIIANASMPGFTNGTMILTAFSPFGVTVIIGNYTVESGQSVVAQMIASNVTNLGSVTVNLTYNASIVQVTSVDNASGNALTLAYSNINNTSGYSIMTAGDLNGLSGDVIIANFTLYAAGIGGTSSPLNITLDSFDDNNGIPIAVSPANGTFNVTTPTYMPPSPTGLLSTQGNFWINYTWSAGGGNVTNSYNVSVNGSWANGSSNTYNNNTPLTAHGWSNISVYSYNSSGAGTLNATPASATTQVANNPVTIGNVSSNYTITDGDTLSVYPTSSDADGDIPTFARNFTNGTFNTTNGSWVWLAGNSDIGNHSWQISVADGYGSVAYANFTVTVNALPPVLNSIVISPSSASMSINATHPFVATAYNGSTPMAGVNISFNTSNITVGNVTPAYVITGADGNATVTFSATAAGTTFVNASNGSISNSSTATVTTNLPTLTSIVVTPPSVTLVTGGNQTFNATAKNGSATVPGVNISWTVSNAAVGSISASYATTGADGNASVTFYASAVGTTYVNATNASIPGSASVTVNLPVLNVTANQTNVTVGTRSYVAFNVTMTNNGTAVSGATVTLTGSATGSGTTNATGIALISVTATSAGTITATASKTGYTSGTTTLTAALPVLTIVANQTNVNISTTYYVNFNVTSSGTAINRATVTLTGGGLPTTTGRTNSSGIVIIRINPKSVGNITATATLTGYTTGTTLINATNHNATFVNNTNTTANTTTFFNATNTTNVLLELNTSVNANVTVNITTSTNATFLNISNPATIDYGLGTNQRSIGEYISINVTGINATNSSQLNYVVLRVYYSPTLPRYQVNSLKLYWYDHGSARWRALGPNVLPYPDYTSRGGPKVVSPYGARNTTAGYVEVDLNHFSEFVLVADDEETTDSGTTTSSGGGGGGGGGGGASGENFSNILVKENYDLYIQKDIVTSYAFTNISNPVKFVNITGNTSAGVINVAVETLKNTSTLLNTSAPGIVYKNVNIWVGTTGFAVPKNIKEAIIAFRVENSWLVSNGVAASDVKLLTWDDSRWAQLETVQKTKDDTYTYFEAKTDHFSPFAISGLKGGVVVPTATPLVTTQATPGTPSPSPTKKVPAFEFVLTVAIISVAYLLGRKRR